jgi:hypothetical protein
MADLVLQIMQYFEKRIGPIAMALANGQSWISRFCSEIKKCGFRGHGLMYQSPTF